MKSKDMWLNTTYACGLITINEFSIVTDTCPIYKWMVGKKLEYVVNYLERTKKLIDIIELGE